MDAKKQLTDAKFGATAFGQSSAALPTVFPREMGLNASKYLQEIVDSGLASDMVSRFEKALAEAHNRKFCVGTPGCTLALSALFLGLDFEPGDEIIVSPIADYGDICGILFENYVPVFCDTEPGTGLISARTIEPCITDRTKAILSVNFFGLPCDYDPIMELAKKHNIIVIEDVCQSILSTYKGRVSGSLTDVSVFSFDSEKTCGADMGGAILMDDEVLFESIKNRAIARGAKAVPGWGRQHIYRGMPLRMPQCTAATCLANWEILPHQVENRISTARMLNDQIRDIPGLIVYETPDDRTHTYWMYGFSIDPNQYACSPSELAEKLKACGIADCGLGKYYVLPAAVPFLSEYVENGIYPFSLPPASRKIDYEASKICPNAVEFMDNFIRWFWTEKYTQDNIITIANIIRKTCIENLK